MTKHSLYLILPLLVLSACSKPAGEARRGSVVEITTAMEGASATKGPLVDYDQSYGIFACVHEDVPTAFEPFKASTYNVYARNGSFNYVSDPVDGALDANASGRFVLTSRGDENESADLYAYAPWTKDAYLNGPTRIPFTAGADVMYAVQNLADYVPGPAPDKKNTGLNPALDTPPLKATFYFRHAMARLVFKFTLKNEPTLYDLRRITVRDNNPAGGTAALYASGTFNAVTGTFNPDLVETTANEKVITDPYSDIASATTPMTVSMLIVPTPVSVDDELSFTFTLAGGESFLPFVLKKEHVRHADDTYGFRAGYTYTFNFTLDNYVYFNGFTIDEDWSPADTDLSPEDI